MVSINTLFIFIHKITCNESYSLYAYTRIIKYKYMDILCKPKLLKCLSFLNVLSSCFLLGAIISLYTLSLNASHVRYI